jgi:hypothetical protein
MALAGLPFTAHPARQRAPDVRKERRPVRLVGRTSRCKNNVFPNPNRQDPRVIPNLQRSSALSARAHCCTRSSRLAPNRVAREWGLKWRTPNSFRRSGSEAGLVRGSITGADASGMTRTPKSCRGMQWRVNPAGSDLLQFNNFLLEEEVSSAHKSRD